MQMSSQQCFEDALFRTNRYEGCLASCRLGTGDAHPDIVKEVGVLLKEIKRPEGLTAGCGGSCQSVNDRWGNGRCRALADKCCFAPVSANISTAAWV